MKISFSHNWKFRVEHKKHKGEGMYRVLKTEQVLLSFIYNKKVKG